MPKKIPKDWTIENDVYPHDLVLTRYSPSGEKELQVIFELKQIANRQEVVSVLIQTPKFKTPLTAGDIRSIPFSLLENHLRRQSFDWTSNGFNIEAKGPQSGRGLSNDQLRIVADLYREAHDNGQPIAPFLAKQLKISKSTVDKRIAAARKAGFLGASLGTKAGEDTQTTSKGKKNERL